MTSHAAMEALCDSFVRAAAAGSGWSEQAIHPSSGKCIAPAQIGTSVEGNATSSAQIRASNTIFYSPRRPMARPTALEAGVSSPQVRHEFLLLDSLAFWLRWRANLGPAFLLCTLGVGNTRRGVGFTALGTETNEALDLYSTERAALLL